MWGPNEDESEMQSLVCVRLMFDLCVCVFVLKNFLRVLFFRTGRYVWPDIWALSHLHRPIRAYTYNGRFAGDT